MSVCCTHKRRGQRYRDRRRQGKDSRVCVNVSVACVRGCVWGRNRGRAACGGGRRAGLTTPNPSHPLSSHTEACNHTLTITCGVKGLLHAVAVVDVNVEVQHTPASTHTPHPQHTHTHTHHLMKRLVCVMCNLHAIVEVACIVLTAPFSAPGPLPPPLLTCGISTAPGWPAQCH